VPTLQVLGSLERDVDIEDEKRERVQSAFRMTLEEYRRTLWAEVFTEQDRRSRGERSRLPLSL